MALHIELGKKGESLAETWLQQKGFRILHRNWRYGKLEIDIIALRGTMLHFIEVKYRSGGKVFPEANVTRTKIRLLLRAIDQFLFQHSEYKDFRLDILSIMVKGADTEYFFIEDVYL